MCIVFLKGKVQIISVQLRIKQSGDLNNNYGVLDLSLDLHNIGLGNLNVQSLKDLEPEASLKKYRMPMKCHATPHWPCFHIPWTSTSLIFLFLLLLEHFSGDAQEKSAFLQQARSLGVIIRAIFQYYEIGL